MEPTEDMIYISNAMKRMEERLDKRDLLEIEIAKRRQDIDFLKKEFAKRQKEINGLKKYYAKRTYLQKTGLSSIFKFLNKFNMI